METSYPKGELHADVAVLGAGPGGYTAAFRAADLGKQVALIERHATLGGVCLNVGCIPSKALLHAAHVIASAKEAEQHGIAFGAPRIDLEKLRAWKSGIVSKFNAGLAQLAKQRKVDVVQGVAQFASPHMLEVATAEGVKTVSFEHAIIAAGSRAIKIPGFPYGDARLMDSTSALELADIPQRLLIIGGGIIGLEMATIYEALGSRVSIVEMSESLMPGADRDLMRVLERRIEKRFEAIHLRTRVAKIDAKPDGLHVQFEGENAPGTERYDRVLLAAGRTPNGHAVNAEAAGIRVDAQGFIPVNAARQTNVPHIYAIGDIAGNPMLAHKATHEGRVAAEAIAGEKAEFEARAIPSVAYTQPEIAWVGLTETQAKAQGVAHEKASFPWTASGRAQAAGSGDGTTKLLYDPATMRVLGCGIAGANAGELIAEAALALTLGARVEDICKTIHPHPTLSETLGLAAEAAAGTLTDLYQPRKKRGMD